MRHIRARRRFKFILTLLLGAAIVVFIESRIGLLMPQMRDSAELKIEEALGDRYIISIGRLDGGIVHPFALSDCIVKDRKGSRLFPSVEINNIVTNYRIWDFLFKRKETHPRIDIKFISKDRNVLGFIRLDGYIKDAKVMGSLNVNETKMFDFTGQVKDKFVKLELKPKVGVVKIEGRFDDDGYLKADAKISHLQLNGFDIVCDIALRNKFATACAEGAVEARNLIINYRPFSDLRSDYKIANNILTISKLEIGDDFSISGQAVLKEPYVLDLVMLINNAGITRIFTDLGAQEAIKLSGTLNGKFEFKGPAMNPKMTGRMEIRNGDLMGMDFTYLSANLKGEGPIVRIEDSRITRESGSFVLAGEIDMSKAGKGNMFEGVKMASHDMAIIWDGWNTVKMQDIEEVRMTKKINEELGISYRKFVRGEKVDESLRDVDEYALEYSLNQNESLKLRMGQDRDFFGLQHKNKF